MKAGPALFLALLLPAPADEAVEVHFAPTGERRVLEAEIASELRRAGREVRVAMFHFTSDRLIRALGDRRRAGVAVRVLIDAAQADDDLRRKLREEGVEVRRVTPRGEEGVRFHHKYAVLDDKIVVTGSYNWTVRGDIANHENLVVLRHEGAARAFAADFEKTWQDKELSRP